MKDTLRKAFVEGYRQRALSSYCTFDDISIIYASTLFEEWYKNQKL